MHMSRRWPVMPRYLLRDRDHAFDHVSTMGIQEVLTAPRSPWQNAYVERFIGSVRRECLDHVIVLTAAVLRRVRSAACTTATSDAPRSLVTFLSLFANGSRLTRVYAALAPAGLRRRSSLRDLGEPMRKHRLNG